MSERQHSVQLSVIAHPSKTLHKLNISLAVKAVFGSNNVNPTIYAQFIINGVAMTAATIAHTHHILYQDFFLDSTHLTPVFLQFYLHVLVKFLVTLHYFFQLCQQSR